jgi:hypothetical protein
MCKPIGFWGETHSTLTRVGVGLYIAYDTVTIHLRIRIYTPQLYILSASLNLNYGEHVEIVFTLETSEVATALQRYQQVDLLRK